MNRLRLSSSRFRIWHAPGCFHKPPNQCQLMSRSGMEIADRMLRLGLMDFQIGVGPGPPQPVAGVHRMPLQLDHVDQFLDAAHRKDDEKAAAPDIVVQLPGVTLQFHALHHVGNDEGRIAREIVTIELAQVEHVVQQMPKS